MTALEARINRGNEYVGALPERGNILGKLEHFEAPYLEQKLLAEGAFSSSEDYRAAFTEFKKYAALRTVKDQALAMSSPKVDAVWHQFILFTQEYEAFCDTYLGGYLHHRPALPGKSVPEGSQNAFVALYREFFGDLPALWRGDKATCSRPASATCD